MLRKFWLINDVYFYYICWWHTYRAVRLQWRQLLRQQEQRSGGGGGNNNNTNGYCKLTERY